MRSKLKKYWHQISYLGIEDNENRPEDYLTRIFFNRTIAILGLLAIPQTITVNKLIPNLGYLHLIWGITCYIALYLTAKNKYHFAKLLLILTIQICGAIVSIVIGPDLNNHYMSIAVVVFGTILFKNDIFKYFIISILVEVFLFVTVEMNLYNHHYPAGDIFFEKIQIGVFLLTSVCLLVYFLIQLNTHQEILLRNKNKILNQKIIDSNSLLTEVHHRVKNNLQIITSLIFLEMNKPGNEHSEEVLKKTSERIKSIALIHEKLYNSDSFSRIDFGSYIERLAEDYKIIFNLTARKVELRIKIENIYLDLERSAPAGLLMNELITNAIKYAYDKEGGVIDIKGIEADDAYKITVKDYGKGFPKNLEVVKKDTVGLRMAEGLVRQIDGSMKIKNDDGVCIEITFDK